MKALPFPFRLRFCMVLASFIAALSPTMAQQSEWGGGMDTSWSTPGNWSSGVPATSGTALFGNQPSDAPVTISVAEGANTSALTFSNTGARSYTFTGETLTLYATGTLAKIDTTNTSGIAAITFNNNIYYTHATASGSEARLTIGAPGRNRFSTLTFNGSIITDVDGSDVGNRTLTINMHADSVLILNAKNQVPQLSFGGAGEVVVGHVNALGENSAVQKTTSSLLSFRSDLLITGISNTYSWSLGGNILSMRISEVAPSTADRTMTVQKRFIANASGGFQWVDNVNSTGKLILDSTYNGAVSLPHTANLMTNASAIVRFSQTGNVYYSGIMSGEGMLENASGGTTYLSGSNTYTGNTYVKSGTLCLTSTGALTFAIGASGMTNKIYGESAGNLILDGAFVFDLTEASAEDGASWTILDHDSLASVTFGLTFKVVNFSGNVETGIWTLGNYQFNQNTGILTVIPEPSSFNLLGLCTIGILLWRKRRSTLVPL